MKVEFAIGSKMCLHICFRFWAFTSRPQLKRVTFIRIRFRTYVNKSMPHSHVIHLTHRRKKLPEECHLKINEEWIILYKFVKYLNNVICFSFLWQIVFEQTPNLDKCMELTIHLIPGFLDQPE